MRPTTKTCGSIQVSYRHRPEIDGTDTLTYPFDRADQVATISDGSTSEDFAYDAFGNLTDDAQQLSSVTAMSYDLADRLTGIDAPGTTTNDTTFSHDALGRIRTRTVTTGSGDVTDTYAYVGTSETVSAISSSAAARSPRS